MANIAAYRINGTNTINDFGLTFTGINYNVLLAPTTQQTLTLPSYIPEGGGLTYKVPTYFILFGIGNNGADVYAAYNEAAVMPTGSFSLSTSQPIYSGNGRFCFAGDTISVIANFATNVSLSFYFKG